MRRTRLGRLWSRTGAALAAGLTVGAALVGWTAIRTTALEMVSGPNPRALAIVAREPTVVLGTAVGRFLLARGKVDQRNLPAVRAAAATLPLDARPYLLIGSAYLGAGRVDLATQTLEAGRRLDPRQRWIHLLLLDRYLRQNKFAPAAEELAVLSRLVGAAQGPIATALAQMSVAPQTRDAVRTIMRQDAVLERSVLTSLASSGVDPAAIFAMASPAALGTAALPGSWGSVLVDRLVKQHRYQPARRVWQRINGLTDQQVAPLLYDSQLQSLPGKPPFNWALSSNNIAGVDVRSHALEINYYGRDSGVLAEQLLLLSSGTYRFGFVVNGSTQGSASALQWSIACDNRPDQPLSTIAVPLNNTPQRVAGNVTVPAGCPAQRLRLNGVAGEFPVTVTATIDRLSLERASAQ